MNSAVSFGELTSRHEACSVRDMPFVSVNFKGLVYVKSSDPGDALEEVSWRLKDAFYFEALESHCSCPPEIATLIESGVKCEECNTVEDLVVWDPGSNSTERFVSCVSCYNKLDPDKPWNDEPTKVCQIHGEYIGEDCNACDAMVDWLMSEEE